MISGPLLLDANLLLLYVVGCASTDYIPNYKRLKAFRLEDFFILRDMISNASSIRSTPNILTEVSNLSVHIQEPAQSEIRKYLRNIVRVLEETFVPSITAVQQNEFTWLGLTDAAIIWLAAEKTTVMSADLKLCQALHAKGLKALNFNHYRDL